jgi:hypothetical protein
MNTAPKTPEPIQHTLTFDVSIDPQFVEYLTKYNDIFAHNRAGSWAFGVRPTRIKGVSNHVWLVYEQDDEAPPTPKEIAEARRQYRAGMSPFVSGMKLPARWCVLDRDASIRAWGEGVKRWGVDWYEDVDAERENVVVQLSLLGEIRYG